MNRQLLAISCITLISAGGCSKDQPAAAPQARQASMSMAAEPSNSAAYVRQHMDDLAFHAQQLPGRNEREQRAEMHDVLTDIAHVLPVLAGPNRNGAIRSDVKTV